MSDKAWAGFVGKEIRDGDLQRAATLMRMWLRFRSAT